MNRDHDDLMDRLQAFALDQPGAALSFTRRLARDNGWTVAFAGQVVAEYRRFLYIAVRAGHPVTPSDAVDQAWHLHLVYTDSYWNDLCRDVLGRPLHHGPTRGGREEAEKYTDWYERTLASYRRLFGTQPPARVWPRSSERFGDARYFRRINTRRHWVISRPAWMQRRAPHGREDRAPSPEPRTVAGLALAGAAMLAGCAVTGLGSLDVFDWAANEFLWFYRLVGSVLLLSAIALRLRAFLPRTNLEAHIVVSPTATYTIAYLAGGAEGAARAALVALCEHRLITLTADEPRRIVRLPAAADLAAVAGMAPFEQRVLARIRSGLPAAELTALLDADTRVLLNDLLDHGLLVRPAHRRHIRRWGALLTTIALALGAFKVVVGIHRLDPVGGLLLWTIGLTGTLAYLALRPPRLTWSGTAILRELRAKYRRFSTRSLQRLRSGMNGAEPDGDTFTDLIPLLVGLYGTRAWGVTSDANPYYDLGVAEGDAGGDGGDPGGDAGGGGDAEGGGDAGGDAGGTGCGGCGGCGGD